MSIPELWRFFTIFKTSKNTSEITLSIYQFTVRSGRFRIYQFSIGLEISCVLCLEAQQKPSLTHACTAGVHLSQEATHCTRIHHHHIFSSPSSISDAQSIPKSKNFTKKSTKNITLRKISLTRKLKITFTNIQLLHQGSHRKHIHGYHKTQALISSSVIPPKLSGGIKASWVSYHNPQAKSHFQNHFRHVKRLMRVLSFKILRLSKIHFPKCKEC